MVQERPVEYPVSAGGVVYKRSNGGIEFVLCGRTRARTWSLPKGTPEPGESMEQTALREVREETGLDVELQRPLTSIKYWFIRPGDKVRCRKTVHFYLMSLTGGSTDLHDPEFDLVQWFPAAEALQLLTYTNESRIAEEALAQIEAQS
jgi:8-oxo-dGTP pyrophosphatase MutT (NUDIX family)